VDALVLVDVAVDLGLDDVVDVVVRVLVNLLALVDNDLLLAEVTDLVVAGRERGELGLVLGGRDVTLLDLGRLNDVLALLLGLVLGVEDRLDVVLDVVDCGRGGTSVSLRRREGGEKRTATTHRDGQPRAGARPPRSRASGGSRA